MCLTIIASLSQDFIATAADRLTNELLNDDQERKLKSALGMEDELKEYHGWRLFTMMFIIWEKNHLQVANPKQELRVLIKKAINVDIMPPEEY